MPTITATISNPTHNYTGGGCSSATVPIAPPFTKKHAFNTISMCIFFIKSDVASKYSLETDDNNNPLQQNSTVLIQEGANYHFRGYVMWKPKFVQVLDGIYLMVTCWGWDGILAQTLVVNQSGDRTWMLESPTILLTDVSLLTDDNYGSFEGDTLWPDPKTVYDITAIFHPDTVTLTGDYTDYFKDGRKFKIRGSSSNDGLYECDGNATFNGTFTIIITSGLTDDTADGLVYVEGAICYIDGASDTLYVDGVGGNLTAVATTIILSTTLKSFVPRGWVQIDDEWIYFDGYDNSEADGKYRLTNCVRACLGTVGATHTEGATVQEKLGMQIAPRTYTIESDPDGGTDWEEIRRGAKWEFVYKLGCLVLSEPWDSTAVYRGTYSIYDEEDAAAVSVNTVINEMMLGPAASLGPGFVAGDLDLDSTTDAIKINRYEYDPQEKPRYVWDAIQDFIRSISLENEVKFWFKHSTGKFRLKVISDDGSPTITLPNCSYIEEEKGLDDVYSAVRVEYTDDQTLNRCNAQWGWHNHAAGIGDNTPSNFYAWNSEAEKYNDMYDAASTAAGNFGMARIFDDDPKTKLVAVYQYVPTYPVTDLLHIWFGAGATPPVVTLKRIAMRVGAGGYSGSLHFRWEGCNDYSTGTHDSASSTWYDIGCEASQNTDNIKAKWVAVEFDEIAIKQANALRLRIEALPNCDGNPQGAWWGDARRWFQIFDIEVNADVVKYAECQLTDTTKGNPNYYYAPASFEKMRGGVKASTGVAGCQRVKNMSIGASTDAAAISIARLQLLASLRMQGQRHYKYQGVMPGVPELGLTIACDEDGDDVVNYTGVLREYTMMILESGETFTTGTVLSTNTDLIV